MEITESEDSGDAVSLDSGMTMRDRLRLMFVEKAMNLRAIQAREMSFARHFEIFEPFNNNCNIYGNIDGHSMS